MTYQSPVYTVRAVPIEQIHANAWNPNVTAPPEMRLLELSIWEDGYTMPIVCYQDGPESYEIVDGYHRYRVMQTSTRIHQREQGLIPVSVIDKPEADRIASTIRHNRARGTHQIDEMTSIVQGFVEGGYGDAWIRKHLGMDREELARLKQLTGVAALFTDREFSNTWSLADEGM